jgi:hypothetical protein
MNLTRAWEWAPSGGSIRAVDATHFHRLPRRRGRSGTTSVVTATAGESSPRSSIPASPPDWRPGRTPFSTAIKFRPRRRKNWQAASGKLAATGARPDQEGAKESVCLRGGKEGGRGGGDQAPPAWPCRRRGTRWGWR